MYAVTEIPFSPAPSPWLPLAEIKQHLRVDHADDDAIIEGLYETATAFLQSRTWTSIKHTAWRLVTTDYGSEGVRLRYPPLISISKVLLRDDEGVEEELNNSSYWLDSSLQYLFFSKNVTLDTTKQSLIVEYEAGHAYVPPALRHAAKLLIGHWYDHYAVMHDARLAVKESCPASVTHLIESCSVRDYVS